MARSTSITSNTVTIGGINTPAPVSVSMGEYSLGCGSTFTSAAGTIENGQTLCVRHTSAAQPASTVTTVLTIGGVSASFATTTAQDSPSGGDTGTTSDPSGKTVTVNSSAGQIENLSNTALPPANSNAPATLSFPNGVFAFDITGLNPGGSATVTITLPAGAAPSSYYKFINGSSFEFLHTAGDLEGAVISGNVVTLTLVDGGRGDADGIANGTIRDPGAPVTRSAAAVDLDTRSGGSWSWLNLLWLLPALARRRSAGARA